MTPTPLDERIDQSLKRFYNRVCSTAGTKFAGDPYTILSKSTNQEIKAIVADAERKARIDEVELAIRQTPIKYVQNLDDSEVIVLNRTIDIFREILNKRLVTLTSKKPNLPTDIDKRIDGILSLVTNAAIKYQAAADGEATLQAAEYLEADRKQAKQAIALELNKAKKLGMKEAYQDVNRWIAEQYKELDSPQYPLDAALVSGEISKALAALKQKLMEIKLGKPFSKYPSDEYIDQWNNGYSRGVTDFYKAIQSIFEEDA